MSRPVLVILWMSVSIHIKIRTNYHNKNLALGLALKEKLKETQNCSMLKLFFAVRTLLSTSCMLTWSGKHVRPYQIQLREWKNTPSQCMMESSWSTGSNANLFSVHLINTKSRSMEWQFPPHQPLQCVDHCALHIKNPTCLVVQHFLHQYAWEFLTKVHLYNPEEEKSATQMKTTKINNLFNLTSSS